MSSLWRNLVHRDRVDRDLDDEIDAVLQLLVDEKTSAGATPEEAHRAAAQELGRASALKDRVRDARAGAHLDALAQDLRYAARLLRRNPLFTLTASLSVAIGIGANTTIFSLANALLLRTPAGIADPERLVDIGVSRNGVGLNPGSFPNFLDIRARTTTLDGVYASALTPRAVSVEHAADSAGVETVFAQLVTANYFTVLAATPSAGRLFHPDDGDEADGRAIAVLSHRFWTRRFHRDPAVVGSTLQINGQPFTVVGVASEGFHGTRIVSGDLWLPLVVMRAHEATALTNRSGGAYMMGGRLEAGVSLPQAAAELDAIGRTLERDYPVENRGKGLRLVGWSPIPGAAGPAAVFLALLMGIVTLVLVVACANVAGILLARAAARRKEFAVRVALGAGRGRLVRQLITETALLFALASAGGVLLARVLTLLLASALLALPFPVDVSLALDVRVLVFTAGLSLAAAVLSGLVPAYQASKTDVIPALNDHARSFGGRSRLRGAFVGAQVAFTIVVVVATGLFARALQHAGSTDPGFDAHGVDLVALDLSLAGYTHATGPVLARDLVERARALPAVESATIARFVPGGLEGMTGAVTDATAPAIPPMPLAWNIVEPGYFATLRIPLIAGRDFNAADRAGAPAVAIVGDAVARRFWPGESAIGKAIVETGPHTAATATPLTIVGVVADIRTSRLVDGLANPFVYVPLQQRYAPAITIVARRARGQGVVPSIRALTKSMNAAPSIVSTQTLEDSVALGMVPQRLAASVSSSLGLVGLLLAALGIYGVAAYSVTRRTREIGIRVALGAQRRDVVALVLQQVLSFAAAGAAIGLLLAAAAGQALASFLVGISPHEPAIFAGAAALFIAVSIAATYVPVRRALRINAMEALRYE